jgi:Fe-S-cluster containining protein
VSYRTKADRALQEIYAEIPAIPGCQLRCAQSCGPIAMFKGEWKRVKRSAGYTPRLAKGSLVCPLLSPTGKCTVYTARPYICRLWGATKTLACPHGCEPERWLTAQEAHDIFKRIEAIAGPEIDGPIGGGMQGAAELWKSIALQARESRLELFEAIAQAKRETQEAAHE